MQFRNMIGAAAGAVMCATLGQAASFTFTGLVDSNEGLPILVGSDVAGALSVDLDNIIPANLSLGVPGIYGNVLTALSITIDGSTWSMVDPARSTVTINPGGDFVIFSSSVAPAVVNASGPDLGGQTVQRVQFTIGSPDNILTGTDSLTTKQILDLAATNEQGSSLNFVAFSGAQEVRFVPTGLTEVPAIPLPAPALLLAGGLAAMALRRRLHG